MKKKRKKSNKIGTGKLLALHTTTKIYFMASIGKTTWDISGMLLIVLRSNQN